MRIKEQRTANSTFAIGGVSCSASTLAVKIPPIANLQTVTEHYISTPKPTKELKIFYFIATLHLSS